MSPRTAETTARDPHSTIDLYKGQLHYGSHSIINALSVKELTSRKPKLQILPGNKSI
jgi:hypothetical protein